MTALDWALVAWCAASLATALGLGWVIRRHPPPDHSPRESSPGAHAERDQ